MVSSIHHSISTSPDLQTQQQEQELATTGSQLPPVRSTLYPVLPIPAQYPPLHYTVPLASVFPLGDAYESPVWASTHEVRAEMRAARDSGQVTNEITVEYFMCDVCTCQIGPDFHEKALYLMPVYAQHLFLDDYGHDEYWPEGDGEPYWQPDRVRIVFEVLTLCGDCANRRDLGENMLAIAEGDWHTLLRTMPTEQEVRYPAHLQEAARIARVRLQVKKHVQQQTLLHYGTLYACYLNAIGWPVALLIQKACLCPKSVAPAPVIPLAERRQQKEMQSRKPRQVYYSPLLPTHTPNNTIRRSPVALVQ